MEGLYTDSGGWKATEHDLELVPVPQVTASYMPVPYNAFIRLVKDQANGMGLEVHSEQYALSKNKQQMFGVMDIRNGHGRDDFGMAVGIRSSYDKTLGNGLVCGKRVFVCDNLAFSGEVEVGRKHTPNVWKDLKHLMGDAFRRILGLQSTFENEIDIMKAYELYKIRAHHIMIEAVKAGAIPASKLPKVIDEWESPKHIEFQGENAWSLHNAFTEVQKERTARAQIDDTLLLRDVFRKEVPELVRVQ